MRNLNRVEVLPSKRRSRGVKFSVLIGVLLVGLSACVSAPTTSPIPTTSAAEVEQVKDNSANTTPLTAEIVKDARESKPEIYQSDCYAAVDSVTLTAEGVESCILANPDSAISVALVGDSHSAHWTPAIQAIAVKYNWKLTYFGKRGCNQGDYVAHDGDGGPYLACVDWTENLLNELRNGDYETVITSNSSRGRVMSGDVVLKGAENEAARAEGTARLWQKLIDNGENLVVILDTPFLGVDIPDCLLENLGAPQECSASYEQAVLDAPRPDLKAAELVDGVETVDLSESFCPERQQCFAYLRDMVVFRDSHHMTGAFAASLEGDLEAQLRQTAALAAHMPG